MMSRTKGCGGTVDVTRETPRSGACEECGFDWTIPVDDAIGLVEGSPARIGELFHDRPRREAAGDDDGRWSPSAYVWHLVDVLRFGTERLWTMTLEPGASVPGWDQDAVAAVRRYDAQSAEVGLRALGPAASAWAEAARATPADAWVAHPVLGRLAAADAIRRNAHEAHHHELDVRRGLGLT